MPHSALGGGGEGRRRGRRTLSKCTRTAPGGQAARPDRPHPSRNPCKSWAEVGGVSEAGPCLWFLQGQQHQWVPCSGQVRATAWVVLSQVETATALIPVTHMGPGAGVQGGLGALGRAGETPEMLSPEKGLLPGEK